MARDRQRAVSEGEASSMTLVDLEKAEAKHTHARLELEEALAGMRITIAEYEADAAVRRQEIEELRAGLEASRNEIKRYTSDGQRSKQREESVRKELHAAQLVVHEGQLQVAGLEGTLAAAEHENTLHTALVEQLRMDGARLKEELEGMRASAGGNKSREGADTLLDELKGLKMQLESSSNERCVETAITCWFSARSLYFCRFYPCDHNYASLQLQQRPPTEVNFCLTLNLQEPAQRENRGFKAQAC